MTKKVLKSSVLTGRYISLDKIKTEGLDKIIDGIDQNFFSHSLFHQM